MSKKSSSNAMMGVIAVAALGAGLYFLYKNKQQDVANIVPTRTVSLMPASSSDSSLVPSGNIGGTQLLKDIAAGTVNPADITDVSVTPGASDYVGVGKALTSDSSYSTLYKVVPGSTFGTGNVSQSQIGLIVSDYTAPKLSTAQAAEIVNAAPIAFSAAAQQKLQQLGLVSKTGSGSVATSPSSSSSKPPTSSSSSKPPVTPGVQIYAGKVRR